MTAKQYLQKMFYFGKEIDRKQKQIDTLRLLTESTGAIRYDKDRVITSLPQAAGYEDKVAKLVDMQHKLLNDIVTLSEMQEIGQRIINGLIDPIDRLILEERYIDRMRWEDIATDLCYSVDHIYYKHRHALKKIKNNSF